MNKNEKALGVLAIVLAPLLMFIYAVSWLRGVGDWFLSWVK